MFLPQPARSQYSVLIGFMSTFMSSVVARAPHSFIQSVTAQGLSHFKLVAVRRMITSILSRVHAAATWNPVVMEIGTRLPPTFGSTIVLLVKNVSLAMRCNLVVIMIIGEQFALCRQYVCAQLNPCPCVAPHQKHTSTIAVAVR